MRSPTGILELHRHIDATANEKAARSIWPGPECWDRKPRGTWEPKPGPPPAVAVKADGYYLDGCRVYVGPKSHIHPIIGIALAWVAVRARRERYTAWLRREFTHSTIADDSLRFVSPEEHVRWAVARHESWIFRKARGRWEYRWARAFMGGRSIEALGELLLASPEWQALPWQSEGVGRG